MARLSKFSGICHTCGISSSDFIRRVYFEEHIKANESGRQAYICESCGKGFSSLMDLKKHVGKYHNENYSCIQCGKSFIAKDHFNRHMKEHNLEPYCCDVCTKTFTRLDNLKIHKPEGCLKSKENVNCDHCEKVFSCDWNLKQHNKVYHGSGPPATCELCAKGFQSKFQMVKHKEREHQTFKFP